jgi:hypothetical protein
MLMPVALIDLVGGPSLKVERANNGVLGAAQQSAEHE